MTASTPSALTALYTDLQLFQNLFQPSIKVVLKVRKGSWLIRRYDRPQTLFERVKACPQADPMKVKARQHVVETLDPLELSARIEEQRSRGAIEEQMDRLPEVARRSLRRPREAMPAPTPWRGWTFSPKLRAQERAIRESTRVPVG